MFCFDCATPKKALDIIKLVSKFFSLNLWCKFQKNLKIGVGHFLWPPIKYLKEKWRFQLGRIGMELPIYIECLMRIRKVNGSVETDPASSRSRITATSRANGAKVCCVYDVGRYRYTSRESAVSYHVGNVHA